MLRRNPTLRYATAGLFSLAAIGTLYYYGPDAFPTRYTFENTSATAGALIDSLPQERVSVVRHLPTPSPLKAIYMTQCVVGLKSFREELVKLVDETELNSIVIDIKDYSGRIGFTTENPALRDAVSDKCRATDIREFIGYLHDKGIYVIGRITVFQDPFMTSLHPERAVKRLSDGEVWKDFKGLSFIDVGARDHWDYTIELSKESYALGYDELNFDYIRYPSDGNMKDTSYMLPLGKKKSEMLKEFFAYLEGALKPTGVIISADIFGMTTTNTDDLNIGQILEHALEHFDYVAPMVYPSHYPPAFNGYGDPNKYPYEVVHYSMSKAVERAKAFDLARLGPTVVTREMAENPVSPPPTDLTKSMKKLRPWLQDFDYGGNYDIAEIRAQIKATYDSSLDSWMLWSPSNKYTVGALDKEE